MPSLWRTTAASPLSGGAIEMPCGTISIRRAPSRRRASSARWRLGEVTRPAAFKVRPMIMSRTGLRPVPWTS